MSPTDASQCSWFLTPYCSGKDGKNAYHQEDLPSSESQYFDEETAEAAALCWLRERKNMGDTRDWEVCLYPDPYEVGERRLNGGERLGPVRILRSSQLPQFPTFPKGKWRNRINRASEWLKWFKEVVHDASEIAEGIEWLQEVIGGLPFFRNRPSSRREGATAYPRCTGN